VNPPKRPPHLFCDVLRWLAIPTSEEFIIGELGVLGVIVGEHLTRHKATRRHTTVVRRPHRLVGGADVGNIVKEETLRETKNDP
jgi:hypothetical protein